MLFLSFFILVILHIYFAFSKKESSPQYGIFLIGLSMVCFMIFFYNMISINNLPNKNFILIYRKYDLFLNILLIIGVINGLGCMFLKKTSFSLFLFWWISLFYCVICCFGTITLMNNIINHEYSLELSIIKYLICDFIVLCIILLCFINIPVGKNG
jgi:hypothetical protein